MAWGAGMSRLLLPLCLAPGMAHAACEIGADVRLNELAPAVAGTDAQAEWVELVNRSSEAVDVSGWVVQGATRPDAWVEVFTIPAETVIPAGGWLVLAGTAAALDESTPGLVRLTAGAELGNAGSNSDAVRLVTCAEPSAVVVDVVAYGANNDDGAFFDEEAEEIVVAKLASKPADNKSLSRQPDGADTNNGAVDFALVSAMTPGAANGGSGGGGCVPGVVGQVRVNELLPNPGAATNPSGATDSGYEWVELYVSADVDLSGWQIQQAGAPGDWGARVKFTFPGGSVFAPGAYPVVADSDIELDDVASLFRVVDVTTLSLGNAEDAVRLVDCAGAEMDTVVYGGANPDGFLGDDGEPLADDAVGPRVTEDASIARRSDGAHSGDLAADFINAATPTPGAPNDDLRCRSAGGVVFINELMPNPAGDDGDADNEWVELYNGGRVSISLTGWSLTKVTSRDGAELNETPLFTFGAGVELPPGEWLVVGGVSAVEAALFTDPFDLPSGSGGDAVLLYDCEGGLADSALYGGANDDLLEEDDGYLPDEVGPNPGDDQCVARESDGVDTNVSAEDFITTSYCSPGASNKRDVTEEDEDPVGGCGGDRAPRSLAPRSGCATSPGGPWWLVFAWFFRRRRMNPARA